MTSHPLLFLEPARPLLAAAASTSPAHGIPAAVWLVLALNVSVVVFFIYRIVGLLRTPSATPPERTHRSGHDTPPPP